jgi:hypothetical protein
MTLGKQLTEQLRSMAAESPQLAGALREYGGTMTVAAAAPPLQTTLEFSDQDRYSVTLCRLDVVCDEPAIGPTRSFLSGAAAEITRRLSFLEESLAVWELDDSEAVAQLRSSPPQRDGEEITYWEVVLRAGIRPGASITRYRWTPGIAEREVIAYPATFALVARMADALAGAFGTLS